MKLTTACWLLLLIPLHTLASQLTDKASYNASYALQKKVADMTIQSLGDLTHDTYQILDFHSRNGYNSRKIATEFPLSDITAFENNTSFLPVNFSDYPKIYKTNTIDSKEYDDKYDIVISSSSFHYLNDHAKQLQTLHRVLKPDGRAIINFSPDYGKPRFDLVLAEIKQQDKWKPLFASFTQGFDLLTPEDFIQEVFNAGFEWKTLNKYIASYHFASEDTFRQWVIGFLSEYHYLSAVSLSHLLAIELVAYAVPFDD